MFSLKQSWSFKYILLLSNYVFDYLRICEKEAIIWCLWFLRLLVGWNENFYWIRDLQINTGENWHHVIQEGAVNFKKCALSWPVSSMINNHMKIFSHFLICILMSELFVSSLEADCSFGDSDGLKELGPRKR